MADKAARTPMKGDGKILFLARLDTFKELLDAGHQQRKVFEEYESELGMSYSQFNRYVNKYIKGEPADGHQKEGPGHKQEPRPSTPASPASTAAGNGGATLPQATSVATGKPGRKPVFQHDPSSGNKLEDLM